MSSLHSQWCACMCKRRLHQYLQDALEHNVTHLWFSEEEFGPIDHLT